MEIAVLLTFIIGYLAITLEHPLRLDKTVPALIMAAICWGIIAIFNLDVFEVNNGLQKLTGEDAVEHSLFHHFGKTAEILIFLIGAMTIVEIIDMHKGFAIIKSYIKTKSRVKLLWIVVFLAYWLSAVVDNLTATIIMVTILRKLIIKQDERIWYVSFVVLAANAGGAWSPIGDVTTTMLWIADKVTALKLIEYVFVPSIICIVIPTVIAQYTIKAFKGKINYKDEEFETDEKYRTSSIILYVGIGMIIFVPIFKSLTHLPPYLGMVLALGIVWLVAELLTNGKFIFGSLTDEEIIEKKNNLSIHKALARIEMPSILFFLGILLAVASLESLGNLFHFAEWLNNTIPSEEVVVILLGIFSAIIDNVPLVAASIGMFQDPIDSELWHFIAFSAGTGGSMLIIGSAAGVTAMGMEKISFGWYLKNIAWLAFIGFIAGCLAFILIRELGLYS